MFNPKNFSIEEIIQKRANDESLYEWANKKPEPIPEMKIEFKKVPLTAGVYNLVRQLLP